MNFDVPLYMFGTLYGWNLYCLVGEGMVTGGAGATVFYNLKQRHPTLDMPVVDYDLALLFQPMLMLGISVGVAFNVIFPDWMITALLIVVFIGRYQFLQKWISDLFHFSLLPFDVV